MAFDLGSVKSIGVPAWLRALVGFVVATAIVSDAELAWLGLHHDTHKEWFVLAIQLAATLIPLLVAALLFAFSTTGPETLRHKTTHLLLNLIPSSIQYVATEAPHFDNVKFSVFQGTGSMNTARKTRQAPEIAPRRFAKPSARPWRVQRPQAAR